MRCTTRASTSISVPKALNQENCFKTLLIKEFVRLLGQKHLIETVWSEQAFGHGAAAPLCTVNGSETSDFFVCEVFA